MITSYGSTEKAGRERFKVVEKLKQSR